MKKILCIGDSNTYGYDPRSYPPSRYPEEVRWTDRLDGWEAVNCGRNGQIIPIGKSEFIDLIRRNAPDLVTVMLGTNDVLEGIPAENTALRMGGFLDSIRKTGAAVMLIAPPPVQRGYWVLSEETASESRKLGALYRELAEKKGIAFADSGEWGIALCSDGVHFAPEGHIVFAAKLKENLSEEPAPVLP